MHLPTTLVETSKSWVTVKQGKFYYRFHMLSGAIVSSWRIREYRSAKDTIQSFYLMFKGMLA